MHKCGLAHRLGSWVFQLGSTVGIVLSLLPAPAIGQTRTELHPFPSATLTDEQLLTGQSGQSPVMLAGALRIPRPGTDRLPAVVLLHASGGYGGNIDEWAALLNDLGVATFAVDSFTGRNLTSVVDDQGRLGRLAQLVDAYRALDLLRRHPRIDPTRIGVMGFSRGGPALYAAMARFQRWHMPPGPEFAVYIALYPNCQTVFHAREAVSSRPIRVFHGTADDYAPLAACREYVDLLRAAGKDVVLTEYPGAHHVFDWAAFNPPRRLPQAQTTRRCQMEEGENGVIMNRQTGQPFSYSDACVERGPTIGYNEPAARAARQAVSDLVRTVLKANAK